MGVIPGMALDLTTVNPDDGVTWGFNNPEKVRKAKANVRSKEALLIIGSPMCIGFSAIMNINYARVTPEEVEVAKEYGRRHVEFCMELYQIQMESGL